MAAQIRTLRGINLLKKFNVLDMILIKIFLAMLSTAFLGITIYLLLSIYPNDILLARKYAMVGILGLVGGLISRIYLRSHLRLLKLLVSIISVTLSLSLLHFVSEKNIGIDFFAGVKNGSNWDAFIQIFLGSAIAWLAINAWRAPLNQKEPIKSGYRFSSITTFTKNKTKILKENLFIDSQI